MKYYGMIYEKHIYFVEDPELLETYADMIASQMLGELLAFQLEQEEEESNDNN